MSTENEITEAIKAHSLWKKKLKVAMDTGESDDSPENVKTDNHCAFGKWLHNSIDPKVKASPHYDDVVKLHAEFHLVAGEILELALDCKQENAHKLIMLGAEFAVHSSALIQRMREWQDNL